MARTLSCSGTLDDPWWHQHALPCVRRPSIAVAQGRPFRRVQARAGILADKLRPVGQPANALVRNHPGCVRGNFPKPSQTRRLAMKACNVMEILWCTQKSGVKAEAARGKVEPRAALGQTEEARKTPAERRTHALAAAMYRLVDARAEPGDSREPRLAGQRQPDAETYRPVGGCLGFAADHVADQRLDVLAGRLAEAHPGTGHFPGAARPDDFTGRREASGRVSLCNAGFCRRPVAGRRCKPDLCPPLTVGV